MNKFLPLLLAGLLCLLSPLYAQYPGGASGQVFNSFLKSKVVVVLQANEQFNESVKKAFQEYWEATSFDFVPQNEFIPLLPVTENSFFYMESNEHFAIIPGGKDSLGEYMLNDFVVYGDNRKAEYHSLGHIIKFMNDYVLAVRDQKLNPSNQYTIHSATATYFNKNAALIKEKTLLIDEADAAKVVDVAKAYTYTYKIVSTKEIEQAIQSKAKDVCYLNFPYVFDIGTGKILYYPTSYGKTLSSSYLKYLINTINKNS